MTVSCTKKAPIQKSYIDVVENCFSCDGLYRLTEPAGTLISSYDRKGGNDDFNNFEGPVQQDWVVLADLAGPGCVSRFWTTGGLDAGQRFRFYFDNETQPRIDASVNELRQWTNFFPVPLAAYEQSCWYSYVPMTYSNRLIIMADAAGTRDAHKLFYQINDTKFPTNAVIESFPFPFVESVQAHIQKIAQAMGNPLTPIKKEQWKTTASSLEIAPHQEQVLARLSGPAIIRSLELQPAWAAINDSDKKSLLRKLILKISWENSKEPSVLVPLGDFFGCFGFPIQFQAAFFGMTGNTYYSRFPMPFRKAAHISLINESDVAIRLDTKIHYEPLTKLKKKNAAYFHAGWNQTTPADRGKYHAMLQTAGWGKYVGCILRTLSLDKSWWLLEGDEKMWMDNNPNPAWQGTGLEDYFTGAWYFKNNLVRPLHGLIYKAPFRTLQYRVHMSDAVVFEKSFQMNFERGPDNASQGYMESVVFYYMQKPQKAFGDLKQPSLRNLPSDPYLESNTLFTDLCNFERFNDYQGALEFLRQYMFRYTDIPFKPMLQLREIAYQEKIDGVDQALPRYDQFIAQEKNTNAIEAAKLLRWFHESPTNAILSIYASNPSRLFLDGKLIAEISNPQLFAAYPVTMQSGQHVLAVEATKGRYPEWVQVCLRTHQGDIMTDGTWRFQFDPAEGWQQILYDATSWPVSADSFVEGPPIIPHLWTEPHPFVDMQAKPRGIWGSIPDRQFQKTIAFRTAFEWP